MQPYSAIPSPLLGKHYTIVILQWLAAITTTGTRLKSTKSPEASLPDRQLRDNRAHPSQDCHITTPAKSTINLINYNDAARQAIWPTDNSLFHVRPRSRDLRGK